MRPVGPDASHTDCILVVGVSRPKLAVVFLTIMLISLFLTFHVLYDSAVYNIQAAQAITERHRLRLLSSANGGSGVVGVGSVTSNMNSNHLPEFIKPAAAALAAIPSSNQISHPMVFPSNRVHFPKTSRRLPQVSEYKRMSKKMDVYFLLPFLVNIFVILNYLKVILIYFILLHFILYYLN